MAARIDILLDDDKDLAEDPVTFDLIEGGSDDQHIVLMSLTEKGENREFPFAGFAPRSRLKSRFNRENVLRDLELELELDGYSDAEIILGKSILELQITV